MSDVREMLDGLRGDDGLVTLAGAEAGVSFEPSSYDADSNTIRMQIHGGDAVIRRPFFEDPFYLRLSVEPGAIDTSRLEAGTLPLIVDHDVSSNSVIGVGVPGSFLAEPFPSIAFRLDEPPVHDQNFNVIRKLKSGILRGVSVGATWLSEDTSVQRDYKDGRDALNVSRWAIKELSVYPVPASATASVLSDQPGASAPNEEGIMTDPKTAAEEQTPVDKAKLRDEGRQGGVTEERQRAEHIRSAAKLAGIEDVEYVDGLVKEGLSAADASTKILEKLAADRGNEVDSRGVAPVSVEQPHAKTVADLAADAIVLRAGVNLADATDDARRMANLSLLSIGREVLRSGGVNVANLSDSGIARAQIRMERAQLAGGGMTTSDLDSVYANVVSKIAAPAYMDAPATFEAWASRVDVPHPYSTKIIRMSGVDELEEIPEGGDAPLGAFDDEYEDHGVKHYGKMLRITEEMIMGDQVGLIAQRAAKMGSAAREKQDVLAYAQLTSNPTLSDGIALFHASHSNYVAAGAGAAPSQTTLGEAIKAMMTQTITRPDGSEQILSLVPRYLVIPISLMTTVEALMSQLYVPTASTGVITKRMRGLEVIVSPRLDATSTTAWYLLADKVQANAVAYGFANGRPGIQTGSNEDFASGALEYKVGIWFGATACDFRGAYYNAGV